MAQLLDLLELLSDGLKVPCEATYDYSNHLSLVRYTEVEITTLQGSLSVVLLHLVLRTPDLHLLLLSFISLLLSDGLLVLLFLSEILLEKQENLVLITFLHGLLKPKHLIADIITYLDGLLFMLKLFPASKFKDHLALFVCTFILFAPLFMLLYL